TAGRGWSDPCSPAAAPAPHTRVPPTRHVGRCGAAPDWGEWLRCGAWPETATPPGAPCLRGQSYTLRRTTPHRPLTRMDLMEPVREAPGPLALLALAQIG